MKGNEDLNVIANVNDHWITVLQPALQTCVLIGVSIFFLFISSLMHEASHVLTSLLILFAYIILLFSLHHFFMTLIEWEISSWIITSEYVIDIEKKLFRQSDVAFVNIDKIEELERQKHGFWANVLDYGDIVINVAASPKSIVCHDLPQPGKWAEMIKSLQKETSTEKEISAHRVSES